VSESATDNPSQATSSFDPSVSKLEGVDPMNDAVLKNMIMMQRANSKAKRQKLARDWFRSELFYNGVQWIVFDKTLKRWREMGLKRTTPTPVTNTYASYCDILSSLLSSIPLEVTYRPLNSGSVIDQIKMQTANELTEAIKETCELYKRQMEAAPKLTRQGEVFLIPQMVQNGNIVNEPSEPQHQNPVHGLFDIMGMKQPTPDVGGLGNGIGDVLGHLKDVGGDEPESSEEIGVESIQGIPKLKVEVSSAFECYMDEESDSAEESAFFIRERSFDTGALKQRYPQYADKLGPAPRISGDISRYFAGSLSRLTSGEFGGTGYFVSDGMRGNNRSNLVEYWLDPCPNYPGGLYVIMINDNVIVKKGPLPYVDENGKPYKNIIQIRAKRRTKNCHGRTPMDDAIPKQVQRNKLESFIELSIYRMASPHWLLPKDCGLSAISGEPGTSIIYNRVSASQNSVLKPEMIGGVPPHPVVIQWLDKIDKDTEYILGLTEALMGQIPSGLPAARALELAMQRSKERHGDVFAEWSNGWIACMNMLLKIVKQVKPIDLYNTIKEDYGGFKLKIFSESDYDLDLEIIPETQQPAPARSTASEMSLIEELTKVGIFNLPPNVQYDVFNRFGLSYLNKSAESDKDYIARENYRLIKESIAPVVQTFDNHAMHIDDHRIFKQTDNYEQWAKANPELAQEFDQHIMAHQNMLSQLQAQQAQQQKQPAVRAA